MRSSPTQTQRIAQWNGISTGFKTGSCEMGEWPSSKELQHGSLVCLVHFPMPESSFRGDELDFETVGIGEVGSGAADRAIRCVSDQDVAVVSDPRFKECF